MTTDDQKILEQVQLLERASRALSSNKGDAIADFSLGVICTSAAQALGLAFQASALSMQTNFMTQQAAHVRFVIESYGQLAHTQRQRWEPPFCRQCAPAATEASTSCGSHRCNPEAPPAAV